MSMQDYFDISEKAFNNGSFVPVFKGENGYNVSVDRHIPADIPTDWSVIIKFGIYELYRKTNDHRIVEMCRNSVAELLDSEDAFALWCAYSVCFTFAYAEGDGRAPFKIMDSALCETLKNTLNKNSENLKKAKIWQGKDMEEGLWMDIVSSARILEMRFGTKLV